MALSIWQRCVACLTSNQNFYWIILFQRLFELSMKYSMKVIGPLLVIFGHLLILTVVITYVFLWNYRQLLDSYGPTSHIVRYPNESNEFREGSSLALVHTMMCLFFAGNIFFNYILCATTRPGTPAQCDGDLGKYFGQSIVTIDGRKVHKVKSRLDVSPGISYRYCHHCKAIKPPRCHHCSVLEKCVYHMDHYCPWMNNTIGYYNYRYFVLFLLYTFLGSFYLCVTLLLDPMRSILWTSRQRMSGVAAFFLFTTTVAAIIAVGVLLFWHAYLIITNQTTLEFYINFERREEAKTLGLNYRNPFDNGWKKNIKRVFGDLPWYVAILPSMRHPPSPDHSFELTTISKSINIV